ncbi:MAG TPA: DUF6044 family protein [Lacunisphaera sp.]|jgi:hypothetical protein
MHSSLSATKVPSARIFYVAVAVVLSGYFLPFLILGRNSYITIHDNLDGDFVLKSLLSQTGQTVTFDPAATIPNVLNGVPRSTIPSGLNFIFLPFALFQPHWAYVANHIIVHLIAFVGMLILLRRHFLTADNDQPTALLVALCFAIIPFYTAYGISVAGQPLLLYAFLNLHRAHRWTDYALICFFPVYSSLALVGPFIISALGLFWLINFITTQKGQRPFLLGIVMLIITYGVVESPMIRAMFVEKSFVSHRMTWNRWNDLSFISDLRLSAEFFFHTQYHTGAFPTYLVLLATIVGSLVSGWRQALDKTKAVIVLSIVTICLFAGFYGWVVHILSPVLPTLKYFNASRYYFLLPPLWLLLFALSLKAMGGSKATRPLIWLFLVGQLALTLNSDAEYKNNIKLLVHRPVAEPTYSQFFSEPLFAQVDRYIGKPKASYKIVSIGMHPSVSQFNGFYTLDGYQSSYPETYKLAFRKIIAGELAKNADLRDYFDGWGNRCYIFVDELGKNFLYGRTQNKKVTNLQLDARQLAALGGSYIFSSVEIVNHAADGLTFEAHFADENSFWEIYLYRIN